MISSLSQPSYLNLCTNNKTFFNQSQIVGAGDTLILPIKIWWKTYASEYYAYKNAVT